MFLLLALFSIFNISDDFNYYEKAYNYVLSDTTTINNVFGEHLGNEQSKNICISEQLVFIAHIGFTDDIIEYEYGCLSEEKKRELKYMLMNEKEYEGSIFNDLKKLNKSKTCNLVMFCSKIFFNKLKVEILIAKENESNYDKLLNKASYSLVYLFYFDKSGNIIKEFHGKKNYEW